MLLKKKLSVLIIEDNLGDLIIIKNYLQEAVDSLNTVHAKNFAQAKLILETETNFDVILLDLTLPDLSGEELIHESLKICREIPLIVLTGYSNKDFSIKTLSLGVSDYLLKDDLNSDQLHKGISYSMERKRVVNELKKSEEKYKSLFNSSPIPMWVYDPETYLFLNVNDAACKKYGYSRKEFLSMTILQIRPNQDVEEVLDIIRNQKKTKDYFEGTFEHFKKNGEIIKVNIRSNEIEFEGKRARLVVANDVTEKIKAENALKQSELRFKALVQDGSDLICILDIEGVYKYVSPTSKSILGIPAEFFLNKTAFNFIHEDDLIRVKSDFSKILSEKRVHINPYRFKISNTDFRWIETILTNMIDDTTISGLVANSRDVSYRYNYEEKIRKQDSLFRAIIEKSSDMKTLITTDGTIMFGTPSITHILGYTEEEYLGLNERDLVHPDDIDNLFSRINQTISGEEAFGTMELRIKTKWGEYRWCEKTITNLLNDPDVNAIVCNFWDITEKKKANLLIKETNDRYDLVSKATSDAIWDYKFAINKTYIAGTGYKQLFGYDVVNEFTDDFFWENKLHPEDKLVTIEKLRAFIADVSQTQCQYEYRFRKADGSYAYVKDRLFIIRENDIPIRIIGAVNDITKQKSEEHHLKLLESIITNTKDAVMITEAKKIDGSGPKIIYVNNALTQMSGYSKEEILGQTPRIFQGPKSDREDLFKLKKAIENKESCNAELINYNKSGKTYWVDIGIAPVTDNTNKVSHFIAIERDITSRKVQEQEREKLIFELLQNNKDLRQFSYITSHNLRGPIANLLGLTNLLEGFVIEDPMLSKILAGIRQATLNFDETIKDLASILNIKDRPSIPKEKIAFSAIHKKIINQYASAIQEGGAIIKIDFSKSPSVYFNKSYLESIYSNLLTNSLKYRKRVGPLQITISSETNDNDVILKFKDTGVGIDLETHKDKLFGLYQRFHPNREGKGLGLFLIKSQLEALNGSIAVESKIDEGTLFILRFKNAR